MGEGSGTGASVVVSPTTPIHLVMIILFSPFQEFRLDLRRTVILCVSMYEGSGWKSKRVGLVCACVHVCMRGVCGGRKW